MTLNFVQSTRTRFGLNHELPGTFAFLAWRVLCFGTVALCISYFSTQQRLSLPSSQEGIPDTTEPTISQQPPPYSIPSITFYPTIHLPCFGTPIESVKMSKDSKRTYVHLSSGRTADLFEEFCRDKLPNDDIYVPPHHQPINPEDEDDVIPDQHAAFGIAQAQQKKHEPAWKDLGLNELMAKGPKPHSMTGPLRRPLPR
ncbi:Apc13p protein-domain-containing protein [Tuber indicum]|nr:Apc13p protein-domain-containing protein [Tuber indicum]